MSKRRTYRVNADSWAVLRDVLVGTPEDFNRDSDTIRGRAVSDTAYGRLSGPTLAALRAVAHNGLLTYVIYSYGTPIAWRQYVSREDSARDGAQTWMVPADRYSVTTSKHQAKVRTALSQTTDGYGEAA